MKKLLQIGAIFCGLLITQYGYSQDFGYGQGGTPNFGGEASYGGGAPADHACGDVAVGDCWCLYAHYEPCYYTTRRCIEEQIPCKKRCCRYVDKCYEVQRCRMVPQYYTETRTCKVPEYYEVEDTKCCKRWVCDKHCKYVPRYYWKHVCQPSGGDSAPVSAPQGAGCCPTGGCPAR